jgi:peptide/nickel transport system permease protein/oligopeptide transport system permease protein
MVLGSLSLCYVARLARASLVEAMRADYVRTARAKGLPERRVVGVHALRNSLIPVVTFLGVDLGSLLAGAIVTEGIFNVPGIGQATFTAIHTQEYATVVGIVTALVLIFMLANLLVDVLYAVLDPRIRL